MYHTGGELALIWKSNFSQTFLIRLPSYISLHFALRMTRASSRNVLNRTLSCPQLILLFSVQLLPGFFALSLHKSCSYTVFSLGWLIELIVYRQCIVSWWFHVILQGCRWWAKISGSGSAVGILSNIWVNTRTNCLWCYNWLRLCLLAVWVQQKRKLLGLQQQHPRHKSILYCNFRAHLEFVL